VLSSLSTLEAIAYELQVDPDNRFVADELEAGRNARLCASWDIFIAVEPDPKGKPMGYSAFYTRFRELALRETRTMTILRRTSDGLPPGEYAFLEMFCDEPGCDCRRVFLYVISPNTQEALAVIAYGWEDRAFYARWMGSKNPRDLDELQGPVLNLLSPQSKLAPAILEAFKEFLLTDSAYVERLKEHYELFRSTIRGKARTRASRVKHRLRT
jgi:hypothetical protein